MGIIVRVNLRETFGLTKRRFAACPINKPLPINRRVPGLDADCCRNWDRDSLTTSSAAARGRICLQATPSFHRPARTLDVIFWLRSQMLERSRTKDTPFMARFE